MSLYFNWSCDFQRFTKSKKLSKFQVRTTTLFISNKSLSTSLFNLQGTICCFQRVFKEFSQLFVVLNCSSTAYLVYQNQKRLSRTFFDLFFNQSSFIDLILFWPLSKQPIQDTKLFTICQELFQILFGMLNRCLKTAYSGYHYSPCFVNSYFSFFCILCKPLRYCRKSAILNILLYKDL